MRAARLLWGASVLALPPWPLWLYFARPGGLTAVQLAFVVPSALVIVAVFLSMV